MDDKINVVELVELLNKYGDELKVEKAIHLPDEYEENKVCLSYRGIIVGSELVSKEFIENNIKNYDINIENAGRVKSYGLNNTYEIFQLKEVPENFGILFMNSEILEKQGVILNIDMYNKVYAGDFTSDMDLEYLFEKFNIHHPDDFRGRSLSVSDVVVLKQGDQQKAFMVDSFGFKKLDNAFFQPKVEIKKGLNKLEANKDALAGEPKKVSESKSKGEEL